MQYLIRTLTDSTGYTFTETIKSRENETFTVVEAESKEEAERIAKHRSKYWHPIVTRTGNTTVVSLERPSEETMESLFGKDYKKGQ